MARPTVSTAPSRARGLLCAALCVLLLVLCGDAAHCQDNVLSQDAAFGRSAAASQEEPRARIVTGNVTLGKNALLKTPLVIAAGNVTIEGNGAVIQGPASRAALGAAAAPESRPGTSPG